MIHYRTSDHLQQSSSYVTTQQTKCSSDDSDTDVYVDVSNSDSVHYEAIQLKSLKVSESMAMFHKAAADSDTVTVVKNPTYEAYLMDKNDHEDVFENIYETIPGEFYQD